MQKHKKTTCLISACLVGLCTRYDGQTKAYPTILSEIDGIDWIPVCPEQLGGLPTPREAADIEGGDGHDVLEGRAKVLTKNGIDLSEEFIKGAHQVLFIAKSREVDTAFLKARSPSCAVKGIIGVTAALLQQNGITLQEF